MKKFPTAIDGVSRCICNAMTFSPAYPINYVHSMPQLNSFEAELIRHNIDDDVRRLLVNYIIDYAAFK